MADEARRFYAVQFHPEVTHTSRARPSSPASCATSAAAGDWNMPDYVGEAVEKIRSQVGNEEVILGLSGGVDSSVAAALIHRAIGDQLTCVFVDNGLLRLNEAEQVMQTFARNLGVKVVHVDAAAQFMGQLAGVSDPEQKRKIIGASSSRCSRPRPAKLRNAKWLAQGTIYPDVIESAGAKTKKAHTIKSHHNVGGLPEQLQPEAARTAARAVQGRSTRTRHRPRPAARHGIPPPLPRPRPRRAHPRRSEARVRRPAAPRRRHLHRRVARLRMVRENQPGLCRIPAGEIGGRHGRRPDVRIRRRLRAVETQDFMTAHWAELPHSLLGKVSNRIINEVRGINRVVYDISGKPPATIEWE
jgi:GMP synthase (glutamine-hydrolysing)